MSSEQPEGGHKKPPIPTPAKKLPAFNIEKRGDRLYQVNNLHKWFAISSLLLFVITVTTVLVDYSREWKRYQRDFTALSVQRTLQDIGKAGKAFDRAKYNQLNQQIQQSQADQKKNETQINEIQKKIDDLNARFYRINQNAQFSKAEYDAEKYAYEEAAAHKVADADELHQKMLTKFKEMSDYQTERDQLSIDLKTAKDDLAKFVGRRDEAQKGVDALLTDYQRLVTRLNTLDPGTLVTSIRNAPLLDFMRPSEQVKQILLSNLYNDQPFVQIARVDRCTTCHLGIDQPAYDKAPQPFKTHPKMDQFLGAASPHPLEQFGCTSCHGGLDRGVSFLTAGHTPRDEKQKEAWVEKYGWHVDEYNETPMYAMTHVESGCYKCHSASPDVPQAAKLNNGRDLIRIYGCFGCHKLPGYDGVRKVGPDLSTVSGKLTKDWVRKWLQNPRDFKSEARMPRFWNNSNNSGADFEKRNVAEINAITDFVFSKSTAKTLPMATAGNGNAAHGKELVETVGCFGCHAVGSIDQAPIQTQTRRKHGFNLASEGSKVSAAWIYNWVKDPKQVWPDTKMPSLRLTDAEAADITAYLTSLKNPEWEKKQVPATDPAALDTVVLEFLRAGSTDIEAREKLKTMTADQKNLYAGEHLVSRYGCYGCHSIPGFENAQPIGTELTEAGSKLISQLDFGFLPIEHERAEWYTQKLKDPRIFDVGRVKRPEELLKMPNFGFKDDEIESIAMVLTSMVKDRVPLEMREKPSAAVIAGRQLVDEKNCKGCHIIETAGGDIRGFLRGQGQQSQWPPNLATEGFKTQPNWLHPFLKDPGTVKLRPWMSTRMPTFHFSERETGILAAYFSALDKVDYPLISTAVPTTADSIKAGAELFTKLQCGSCHPTSSAIPPGKTPDDLAPNLMLAHDRLRPEWIAQWINDPQKIMPGTRMPNFFSRDSKTGLIKPADPKILDGDVQAQIKALRDHVFFTLGGVRTPATD